MVDVKGSRSTLMSNTYSPRRQVSRSQRFGAKTILLPGLTEMQFLNLTELENTNYFHQLSNHIYQ